jgi:hypothetical protein
VSDRASDGWKMVLGLVGTSYMKDAVWDCELTRDIEGQCWVYETHEMIMRDVGAFEGFKDTQQNWKKSVQLQGAIAFGYASCHLRLSM